MVIKRNAADFLRAAREYPDRCARCDKPATRVLRLLLTDRDGGATDVPLCEGCRARLLAAGIAVGGTLSVSKR